MAALLAYSRGDQATPQILFFSIPKPFLSFDQTSFQTIFSKEKACLTLYIIPQKRDLGRIYVGVIYLLVKGGMLLQFLLI